MNEQHLNRRIDVLVFAALAGLVATFVHGYFFGAINQVCFLPRVMNVLDPTYLASDPIFADYASRFGIRAFFVNLIALLARVLSLPLACLLLTWFQNAAVALVTYAVAKELFDRSHLAAMVAVALVMSVRSIFVGGAAFLYIPGVDPQVLATGIALFGLWQGIKCRPVACAALSVLAMLLHPLAGVAGLFGLVPCGLSAILGIGVEGRAERIRMAAITVTMAAVLSGLGLLFWMGVRGEQLLSAREFVDLYARFRNPHHLVPSQFLSRDWPALAYFFLASCISWVWWYRQADTNRAVAIRIAMVAGVLIVLMLCGWLFVEVWPTRFWATFQAYRFVFVFKWLGLLLFARTIARLVNSSQPGQSAVAAMMFFPVGLGQPLAVLWAHITELVRRRTRLLSGPALWLLAFLPVLIGIGIVALTGFRNKEFLALALLTMMMTCWLVLKRRWHRQLAAVALVGLAIGLIFLHKHHPLRSLSGLLKGTKPTLVLADKPSPLGDFCQENTPTEAVFLTPPDFDRFWMTAQRSRVVAFKCIQNPSDSGLLDWRQKLTDCYGGVKSYGWGAASEMKKNYHHISDARMLSVAEKYGADFAVLYKSTSTRFPIVFEGKQYKVARLSEEFRAPTVSVIAFRGVPGGVESPTAYFNRLIQMHFQGALVGSAYLMPLDSPISPDEALAAYELATAEGRLEPMKGKLTLWEGTGPDGIPVTVLFFVTAGES